MADTAMSSLPRVALLALVVVLPLSAYETDREMILSGWWRPWPQEKITTPDSAAVSTPLLTIHVRSAKAKISHA